MDSSIYVIVLRCETSVPPPGERTVGMKQLAMAIVTFLVLFVAAWSTGNRAFADDGDVWKSPPIPVHVASCNPHCNVHYNGDPVPIKVVAPDGLDPRTAKIDCDGNGCQFDHGDVVLHHGDFIGTWYSRSEAVTIYVEAHWEKH